MSEQYVASESMSWHPNGWQPISTSVCLPTPYRHRQSGLVLAVDWQTEYAVGLCGGGFTWTGLIEAFERQWEAATTESE